MGSGRPDSKAAHGQSLGATAAEKSAAAGLPTGGERPGDWIGPYKLMEVIGEGGFGVVWLAERREPMVQRVALKIIKPGMDSRAVIARFEQERQALAVMDHPNVARVLDGGVTPAGRPYFVMEHIQGEPITVYCDRQNLRIRQRLELFTSVCAAVQHAHTKGIIHRDIKPSNILVAVMDGQAIAKVIDFGVAKAISHTLTEKTIFTERGQLIGTPEYMSPEQAEMGATDIDTRTDVYSLGVILYELLSGLLPFDVGTLRAAGYDAIRRIIREQEAVRPSTRLSTAENATALDIALHRQVQRDSLARELRRDLDWIPLKALRKDRTERYGSPAELAGDVTAYLEGRPLAAGPQSSAYRLRKLVGRNKGPAAAAAGIVLALVLGMAGFAWQAHRIGIERDRSVVAGEERDRAQFVTDFVVRSLRSQDPDEEGHQQMTMVQAMAQTGEGLIHREPKDQSATEAVQLRTISAILDGNGRSGEAEPLAERALKIEQRLHLGDHPDVAADLVNLAHVRESLGRVAEAEPLYRQALEMSRRLHKGDHPEVASSLSDLAYARLSLGRMSEAEGLHAQALEMFRRLYKGDDPSVATSMNNLAFARKSLGRPAEAEPLYLQALEMYRRLFPGDNPQVARTLINLAGVRVSLGRASEAEPLYVQSLEMNQRMFKGDHPMVATSLYWLASVRESLDRASEAEPLYLQALEMYQRLFRGDHPNVAAALDNLAGVRVSLGRASEAEPLYLQALEMYQRLFRGDHPSVATALSNLATVRRLLGRPAEAELLYVQALEMLNRLSHGGHPDLANTMKNFAACLGAQGRLPEALDKARQAADMAARILPADHPTRKSCDAVLADITKTIKATGG